MPEFLDYSFAALPAWARLVGGFQPDCLLRLTPEAEAAGRLGTLELHLLRHGGPKPIGGVTVSLGAVRGVWRITVAASDTVVDIGAGCIGNFDMKLWRNARLSIGAGTTANQAKIILADGQVRIGRDCMMSDEVLIQAANQHGLIDAETLQVLGAGPTKVEIADHVWLSRRSLIMPNVRLGFGAVIGAGSVVTRDVPAMSVAAGVPARVVRSGTTWSRSPDGPSAAEVALIRAHGQGQA